MDAEVAGLTISKCFAAWGSGSHWGALVGAGEPWLGRILCIRHPRRGDAGGWGRARPRCHGTRCCLGSFLGWRQAREERTHTRVCATPRHVFPSWPPGHPRPAPGLTVSSRCCSSGAERSFSAVWFNAGCSISRSLELCSALLGGVFGCPCAPEEARACAPVPPLTPVRGSVGCPRAVSHSPVCPERCRPATAALR